MARIICISNFKGGVSKTTTAVTVSHGLALAGYRVLLIDLDSQNNVSKSLGVDLNVGLPALVLTDMFSPTEARPGLSVLSAGKQDHMMGAVKIAISADTERGKFAISDKVRPLSNDYDFVFLDTPPSYDPLAVAAFYACDEVIAPVLLEPLAVSGLVQITQRLSDTQKHHSIKLRYVVPSMLDIRKAQTEEILNGLKATYGNIVTDSIRTDTRISEAPGHGETVFEYAANGRAATDYTKLIKRIVNDG